MELYFIKYIVYSKSKITVGVSYKEERTKIQDLTRLDVRNIENHLKEFEENHVFNNERKVTKIELINFNLL